MSEVPKLGSNCSVICSITLQFRIASRRTIIVAYVRRVGKAQCRSDNLRFERYWRNADREGSDFCLATQHESATTSSAKTFIVYALMISIFKCSSGQCICDWCFTPSHDAFKQAMAPHFRLPFPSSCPAPTNSQAQDISYSLYQNSTGN